MSHLGVKNLVVWAAAIAIVCASLLALAQKDFVKMLSYIVVAEVGYMVGGVWLANKQGLTGAIFHILNDSLMTLCFFLVASAIAYRTGKSEIADFRGLFKRCL